MRQAGSLARARAANDSPLPSCFLFKVSQDGRDADASTKCRRIFGLRRLRVSDEANEREEEEEENEGEGTSGQTDGRMDGRAGERASENGGGRA